MFKRDILTHLENWAKSSNRKPLVLRGARQVGKTSVVNEFGRQFDNYLYINLDKPQNKVLFNNFQTLDQLLLQLFALSGKQRKEGRTLLFLDEIQNSPEAIHQLRYFYEEKPELYIIAAGSLLESLVNIHVSFPVGRVEYMAMRPVSFREFLSADHKDELRQYIEHNPEQTAGVHDTLMTAFRNYAIVGGMPEAVDRFTEGHDIVSLNNIYESLLRGYKDDVEKYAPNKTMTQVIRFIIDKGWSATAQKVTLGSFAGSSYKARETSEAFRIMERAMLLELIYPNANTDLPLIQQQTRAPKLIWLDAGLANYANKVQKDVFEATDILDAWRGAIAEQLVGQELLTLSNKVSEQRYFWNRARSEAEVDFEYVHNGHVIPIEVKAGHNAHLRSLHEFMDISKESVAVRVWSQPFQIDNVTTRSGKQFTLLNVPFYLIGFLPQILSKHLEG